MLREGTFQQNPAFLLLWFPYLLRGFCGDLRQYLQSSGVNGSMEKQCMMYPGTRKKISSHPRNGSHPLGDAYTVSVLPCFHADVLSMLTENVCPFIWCCSIWPRGFLSGCTEITGVRMRWLFLVCSVCHCVSLCTRLPFSCSLLHSR